MIDFLQFTFPSLVYLALLELAWWWRPVRPRPGLWRLCWAVPARFFLLLVIWASVAGFVCGLVQVALHLPMTGFLDDAPKIGAVLRYALVYATMRVSYRALRAYQLAGSEVGKGPGSGPRLRR